MRVRAPCWNICLLTAVVLTVTVARASSINVLQVEADGNGGSDGYPYAPVNFAGSTTLVSGGITYHALSDPGSATVSTYSGHAATVRNRLLAADGPTNPVTDDWCLTADDFLDNYVKPSAPSTIAIRPSYVSNAIKVVNHSWVGSYGTDALEIDAVRRMDYMIRREDLVMVSGAVSMSSSSPTPLNWASRNGIAVRGTQAFNPSYSAGIGKSHADLWGPKNGAVDEAASYETPGVAGYAAALIEAADNNGWGNNGINGLRHEVVKSVLMTGANKTDFTTNGFTSWISNGVNNLDNLNGAGRADYEASLSVLTGGPQSVATVTGMTINAPVVTTATAGWWYESALSGYGTEALVIDATEGTLTDLTATLAWDVTQAETSGNRLNTTDAGVIFTNLDLELRPVVRNGDTYTLGSSLGFSGLLSESVNDNVEHLYYTGSLDSGYYAFVISNDSSHDWNYGFSYRFTVVPEPGTLSLLVIAIASMWCIRRRRIQTATTASPAQDASQ